MEESTKYQVVGYILATPKKESSILFLCQYNDYELKVLSNNVDEFNKQILEKFITSIRIKYKKKIYKRKQLIILLKDFELKCVFMKNYYNYNFKMFCENWIKLYNRCHGNIFNRF